jgi:starch phosphorylase
MIEPEIAYFSMEIAVDPAMPTYSGGLGILAGDMLRSAADREVPMVAVTLLHRKGYFRQTLDAEGRQSEGPEHWNPAEKLNLPAASAQIVIEGRPVRICAWFYSVRGVSGHLIPIYFLDTDLEQNDPYARSLSDLLYGGDARYRLCQEAVLGQGGLRILEALGLRTLKTFHMNEGHSALLGLCLLERQLRMAGRSVVTPGDVETVRRSCVFTTHTPVPAGHDQFSKDLARQVLGSDCISALEAAEAFHDGTLNMTYLALRFSHYINGVAMHHGEISRGLFPDYPVRAITNGVHAVTWSSPSFCELYDRHVPEWRKDNLYLRYAIGIPLGEIRAAHLAAKRKLLEEIRSRTGRALDEKVMTIGFARRAAAYKRLELFFSDCERLKWIAKHVGPLQVVCGGKAHPQDQPGKESIQRVFAAAAELGAAVPVVYVENYDMSWARLLTSGADLWLNTPLPPQESSGTSGMKAALNGVPSFSVLDGWWIEGHVEGFTGWSIEDGIAGDVAGELSSLYGKLARIILPMYYGSPDSYDKVMRFTIALNASFFNTQRMVSQYVANAYGTGAMLLPNSP